MDDNDFGPWIVWGKEERPAGLRDDQRVDVVFINQYGELGSDQRGRSVGAHVWEGTGPTLAYRVKREEVTHVLYVSDDCFGTPTPKRWSDDTHKITYILDGAGEVLSCKMEKL